MGEDLSDRLASIGGVARRSLVVAGYAAMSFERTSRISSLHPTAVAYFFSVAMVGECRLSERDVSSRVTAGALVPIFFGYVGTRRNGECLGWRPFQTGGRLAVPSNEPCSAVVLDRCCQI